MNQISKISRRNFFKSGGIILLVPFITAWYELISGEKYKANPGSIVIQYDMIPQGFSYHQQVIIYREKENIRVFEAKCTHLGCKINQDIDGHLVCPCHGSRFDGKGFPLQGPAMKPLKEYHYKRDRSKSILTIEL